MDNAPENGLVALSLKVPQALKLRLDRWHVTQQTKALDEGRAKPSLNRAIVELLDGLLPA